MADRGERGPRAGCPCEGSTYAWRVLSLMVRAYSRAGPPNPSNLEPRGVCDRCRRTYRLADLQDQHDWRGTQLVNLNIKVCPTCLDDPSPAFRIIILGPDPEPIRDPRPGYPYSVPIDED